MFRATKLIPALIFLVSFGATLTLERIYDRHHLLDQFNTIFDADPNRYIPDFSGGWGSGNFRHPFGGTVFSLPIRAIAKFTSKLCGGDEMEIRRDLAMLVVPFFEGAKNLILYLTLISLGLSLTQAIILCGVNLSSLSAMTIGSIPETFPISSMVIVLFVWLMIRDFNSRRRDSFWLWAAAGSFAIGITVTNIIPLVAFFMLGRRFGRGDKWARCLLRSAMVGGLSLIAAFVVAASICVMYSASPKKILPNGRLGDLGVLGADKSGLLAAGVGNAERVVGIEGMNEEGRRPSEELIIAAASTFAGVIKPDIIPNEHYLEYKVSDDEKPTFNFRLAYSSVRLNSLASVTWVLLFFGILLLGAQKAYIQSTIWRVIVLGSLALIAFNFALHHLFYSRDMFLYALHWQVSMIYLLAGLSFFKIKKMGGSVLLIALVLSSIITGIQIIEKTIAAATAGTYSN
jgi:hypothetical protein